MATATKLRPNPLDPVKLDPTRYKIEFENERVRVLRIKYGPRAKSVMHSHPDGVAVFLTPRHARFAFTNGQSTETHSLAGEVKWSAEGIHLPENLDDHPFELVLVELKI
jgi:hypothetical protein